jgi:hypothetical protein
MRETISFLYAKLSIIVSEINLTYFGGHTEMIAESRIRSGRALSTFGVMSLTCNMQKMSASFGLLSYAGAG